MKYAVVTYVISHVDRLHRLPLAVCTSDSVYSSRFSGTGIMRSVSKNVGCVWTAVHLWCRVAVAMTLYLLKTTHHILESAMWSWKWWVLHSVCVFMNWAGTMMRSIELGADTSRQSHLCAQCAHFCLSSLGMWKGFFFLRWLCAIVWQ